MKEIMVNAHKLAKTMEGDYQARLALALRAVWKEERVKEITIRELNKELNKIMRSDSYEVALWEKYGKQRLYVNYYTGGGWRKGEGFLELSNGVIVGRERNARNSVYELYREFEGYKVKGA